MGEESLLDIGGAAAVKGIGAAAGGAIIGGLIGGHGAGKQYKYQRKAMNRQFKLNLETMRQSHDLNRHMRSTAVQDRMADLKAAGINPILAAKYDSSSPSTGLAGVGLLNPPEFGSSVLSGASTAVQMMKTSEETEKIAVETDARFEEFLQLRYETERKGWMEQYFEELAALEYQEAEARAGLMTEQFKIAKRLGEVSQSEFGLWMRYLGEFTGAIGNVFSGSHHF